MAAVEKVAAELSAAPGATVTVSITGRKRPFGAAEALAGPLEKARTRCYISPAPGPEPRHAVVAELVDAQR